MTRSIKAGIAFLVAASTATTALAANGCGPGGFRYGPYDRCHWAGAGPDYYGPRPIYHYGYARRGWYPNYGYGYRHGGYGWHYRY